MRKLFSRAGAGVGAPEKAPVPLRLRLGAPLAMIPVVMFTLACLVYNAPASPARNRVAAVADKFMGAYFWQDWQLFGPTPGDSTDLIYLEVQIKTPSGQVMQTSKVEIEKAIDQTPRQFRINPTKLPGVLLALDQAAEHYDEAATKIKKLPPTRRKAAQTALDKQFSSEFLELQRFLSTRAAGLYPQSHILAVRATFATRAIVPFSERYEQPQPHEPVNPLMVTSWLPYTPGVAQ